MALSWLDRLLFGIRLILDPDGVELPDRPALQFAGEGIQSVEDDPTNKRTVVSIGAGAGAVPNTRKISVSSELTITPSDGVLDEDLALGFAGLTSNTQHGNRGGGSLHSTATSGAAGFMSNTDKAKLDLYPPASDMASKVYVDDAIALVSGGGVASVTGVVNAPVIVDNTDPANPIVDWTPSTDVVMGGHAFTSCTGVGGATLTLVATSGGASLDASAGVSVAGSSATSCTIGHDSITTAIVGITDSVCAGAGSTKQTGRSLRNTTAATSGTTVQVSPSDVFEGSAWVSGALKYMRTRRTTVTRTNGNLDDIYEYDTGSGTYSEAARFTTSTAGQFVAAWQSYAFACGGGGYFHDSSGSGVYFPGSGQFVAKNYDASNPWTAYSDGGFIAQTGGANTRISLDTSGRGYYIAKAIKPTSSGGAVTIALSSQNVQHAVTEAATVTFSGLIAGMTGTIEFIQTTGYTITLPDRGATLEYDATIYGLGLTSIVSSVAASRTILTYLVTDNPATRLLIIGRAVTVIP